MAKETKLTDNDILILMESAEVNANTKAPSIYSVQIYSALKELHARRTDRRAYSIQELPEHIAKAIESQE